MFYALKEKRIRNTKRFFACPLGHAAQRGHATHRLHEPGTGHRQAAGSEKEQYPTNEKTQE